MSRKIWKSVAVASLLSLACLGCESTNSTMKADCNADCKGDCKTCPECKNAGKKKSLYERLGGEPAITAVVDDFVARTAANPKVNFTRKGEAPEWAATPENVAHLKKMAVAFIAQATGGPQKYAGKDMRTAHTGMKITEAQFNAAAADLAASLDKFKVPKAEKDELMAIAASTKGDIVGR